MYLEELERVTDRTRKAETLAKRVANQTHEIASLIVSREHTRQSNEALCEEANRLCEEINHLRVEKDMQKALPDMWQKGFEETTTLLEERDDAYQTLAAKYEERRQHVMNSIHNHIPLALAMPSWPHL